MTQSVARSVVVGSPLQLGDVARVARTQTQVSLSPQARAQLAQTRQQLEARLADGATIYGVNTGFGALSETRVPDDKLGALQLNLLRSHAVGVGRPLPRDVVRALLLLRAHTLALGASGVTPQLAEHLVTVLNAGITPVVPCKGSVGASGDLAPLAHLALVLVGEGLATTRESDCTHIDGGQALQAAGIRPYELAYKEGLSLINGTQVMTAIGALALCDAAELIVAADVVGALSLDTHLGTVTACDPRIHAGKAHPGQLETAALIRSLIEGSPLNASHRDCRVVQDAYSMRCMPQVHGAVRGAFAYAKNACEIEINSFTDNPLVLARDPNDPTAGFDVLSGGNFHGATIAVPLDHMSAALTTLATMSERRSDRFMNPDSSRGLPAFLADHPGVQSGFMMVHVTAAALASECKADAHPASVDTIPTSAGKEDHVSMGPLAARKLARVVENLSLILAIEATIGARALDLRDIHTSPKLMQVHRVIRQYVGPYTGDRSLTAELTELARAIVRGELREAASVPSI